MLGTVFLPDKDVKYYLRIRVEKQNVAGESRNGLWIEVLRPEPVVGQFFMPYGHPIRDRCSVGLGDRGREIASMALVYIFALYFPSGLVALIWMEPGAQYLWLGYQIHAILIVQVVRIAG